MGDLFIMHRSQKGVKDTKMSIEDWAAATRLFNRRMQEKHGAGLKIKMPDALMKKLANIEQQIARRIKRNDYRCE